MLSQPLIVWSVSTYIPLAVYTFPFHSILSHTSALSFENTVLLIVKSIVITLSQPAELVMMYIAESVLELYVIPSIQVYSSHEVIELVTNDE